MSLCTLGFAEDFREQGIAVNSLWPRTTIATDAVKNLLGGDEAMASSRSPEIVADAAHAVLTKPSRECTGRFFIDDEVLIKEGIRDSRPYRAAPAGPPLAPDIFVEAGSIRERI